MSSTSSATTSRTSSCSPSSGCSLDASSSNAFPCGAAVAYVDHQRLINAAAAAACLPTDASAVAAATATNGASVVEIQRHVVPTAVPFSPPQQHHIRQQHLHTDASSLAVTSFPVPIVAGPQPPHSSSSSLTTNCASSAPYHSELAELGDAGGLTEDALFTHANYARRPPNPFSFDLTPPPPAATTPYSPPLPLVFSPSSVAAPVVAATSSSSASEEHRLFGVDSQHRHHLQHQTSKPALSEHPLATYLSTLQQSEPVWEMIMYFRHSSHVHVLFFKRTSFFG